MFGDTGEDVMISVATSGDPELVGDGAGPDAGLVNLAMTVDDDAGSQGSDVVNGGWDDDVLLFGDGDTVTGGNGADTFVAGPWMTGENNTVVTDFDPEEDRLVVMYDGDGVPVPMVSVNGDGDATVSFSAGEASFVLTGVGAGFTAANVEMVMREAPPAPPAG